MGRIVGVSRAQVNNKLMNLGAANVVGRGGVAGYRKNEVRFFNLNSSSIKSLFSVS